MKLLFSLLIFSGFFYLEIAQSSIPRFKINETVPYIYLKILRMKTCICFLDAQEQEEYDVSHLKNSIFVGYNKFESRKVTDLISKKIPYCLLFYWCSKLNVLFNSKMGYTNVKNLYGVFLNGKMLVIKYTT
jgi:rhodanese-related sulfurtransferase